MSMKLSRESVLSTAVFYFANPHPQAKIVSWFSGHENTSYRYLNLEGICFSLALGIAKWPLSNSKLETCSDEFDTIRK